MAAVGIGAAGFVDVTRTVVMFSPHLNWRREPLRAKVAERVRLPVVVDNDANTAALAECRFGAGRGHRFVLCATLGTGIGGALVFDNRVYRGANGMAGEFGHMQVVPDGHRCECGNRGCWEQYASGNALVRDAREMVRADSPMAHHLRELVDGDASRLEGPQITQAARDGDPLSIELLADVGRWLGVGLAGMAAAFDPGCIIIGGGLSDAGELLIGPTRAGLRPVADRARPPHRAGDRAGRARPQRRLHRRGRHGPLGRPPLAPGPGTAHPRRAPASSSVRDPDRGARPREPVDAPQPTVNACAERLERRVRVAGRPGLHRDDAVVAGLGEGRGRPPGSGSRRCRARSARARRPPGPRRQVDGARTSSIRFPSPIWAW